LKPSQNQVASIKQRLLNISHDQKEDFQYILNRYALERFLFRISCSRISDEFILKGAMLFLIWREQIHRPTKDMDLLGYGDSSAEYLRSTFREICKTNVEPDGLDFDPESISVFDIRDDQEYGGQRIKLMANLGKAKIPLQIDIGFGDAISPEPQQIAFPTLLDMPQPLIKVYPPETVISEKLQAMVDLGIQNSRMKDFFDILFLAMHFEFNGQNLVNAIQATFERRATDIPMESPIAFTNEFANDPQKKVQWKAFLRKNKLGATEEDFPKIILKIREFLEPVLFAAARKTGLNSNWKKNGRWSDN
jgi:predicted nucleotidyltransferase component of viral defense system